jgi:hypothetical protein
MLTLQQIEQQYPESLRPFRRAMLREYLQYKILEIVFASEYASRLAFLGGTALRIVYDNTRFSEDLDFDNFSLGEDEFAGLSETVKTGLARQGMAVEMRLAGKEAYRCEIRLPDLLFPNGFSAHEGEKIMIQIDSLAHGFDYAPDRKILNKFDVFSEILVTPPDILLSQKLFAAVSRKRPKGRDFFDVVFLLSRTGPNYDYLKLKMGVGDAESLRRVMLEKISAFDFAELASDVEPFLFNPSDSRRVALFPEYMAQAKLG